MFESNLDFAFAYYKAMSEKDILHIEQYVHPDIQFIGPMATMTGKEAYLDSVKKFCALFDRLVVRAHFSSNDQAMLAYDVYFPHPIGLIRAAALMTIKDSLVTCVELFYDAGAIEKMGNQIFSKS